MRSPRSKPKFLLYKEEDLAAWRGHDITQALIEYLEGERLSGLENVAGHVAAANFHGASRGEGMLTSIDMLLDLLEVRLPPVPAAPPEPEFHDPATPPSELKRRRTSADK